MNNELIIKRTTVVHFHEGLGDGRFVIHENANLIEIYCGGKYSIGFINPIQEIKNKRRGWNKINFWCIPLLEQAKYHPKLFPIEYSENVGTIIYKLTKEATIHKFLSKIEAPLTELIINSTRITWKERQDLHKTLVDWILRKSELENILNHGKKN